MENTYAWRRLRRRPTEVDQSMCISALTWVDRLVLMTASAVFVGGSTGRMRLR